MRVDVAHRRAVGLEGGVFAVVGGDFGAVGIVWAHFGAHASADDNVAGYLRTVSAVQARVIGVGAGVCGAGRVTHQENARRVAAKACDVGARPGQRTAHVLARRRILEIGREAVFDVDPDHAAAREPAQYIGVDLGRAFLVALDEGAAVREHHDRRIRRLILGVLGGVHIEHLSRVCTKGDVACHGKVLAW